jgi:PAS domain S-box-containing protein
MLKFWNTCSILCDMSHEIDPRYGGLIFDNIPHGIFTVDAEGRITSFNRAAEEITGWEQGEVLGKPCTSIFNSNHCAGRCFLFNSIEQGEPHRDCEVQILTRDGTELPVAVSTASLKNDRDEIIGGIEMFRDLTEVNILRQELEGTYRIGDIVSKSAAMKGVRDLLPLVARSDSTVLIEGEPGTGKELVARAIHNMGPRRDRPFIGVNCGAIPDTLVESELFGYVRGAFTDAKQDKPGRFAAAQGGTLLLDEIGDISAAVQVKLLRVLQEREYVPLGSSEPVKADVRILAATNRDLSHEAMNGRFRQDLYFRLNVVRIVLPPLRSRWEDIPILVPHFIERFNTLQGRRIGGISERAMTTLSSHSFPGNVRELENAIEHAFVVCTGEIIRREDLPPHFRGEAAVPLAAPREAESNPLDAAEAATIRDALKLYGSNRTRTAQGLGVSRNTLWRKMKKYGIS